MRIVTWAVAAGFKAPFAWLLVVWGVLLWRRGQRRPAVAALGTGTGILVTAVVFSRHGSYTSQLSTGPGDLLAQARIEWSALWPTLAVLLIGAFLLGADLPRVLPPRGLPAVVGLGGLLYGVNLLVWKAGGYYAVAPIWLIGAAGVLITVRAVRPQHPAGTGRVAAGILAVAIAGYTMAAPNLYTGIQRQLRRDATVASVVTFATRVPPGTIIGVNGAEAATQFETILALDGYRARRVRFRVLGPDDPVPVLVAYYVQLADQGTGDPALMQERIMDLPRGAIYRVDVGGTAGAATEPEGAVG
ncbi:MAG: hypothetical protein P8Z68_10390 [Kineosporiaceae bacterium]